MITSNTYTDVNFPITWTDLSQVNFEYSGSFLAIDNVDFTQAAPVAPTPVPSLSAWMAFVLFALIGLLTFRKFYTDIKPG